MTYIVIISQTKVAATSKSPREAGVKVMRYLKDIREKPPLGIDIHNIYLPLGRFDSIIIFEAPDNKTALKFANDVGLGTGNVAETVPLISIEEI